MNKIISLAIFLIFLLASCTREKDPCGSETKTSYKYISKASLEKTQYFSNPAFDTISFKSNKGDTLIFVKTKTDTTWYNDYIYNNTAPGCPPSENQRNLEITNTYLNLKGSGYLLVKHSRETITQYDHSPGTEVIEIYFLQSHFYYYEHNFSYIFHPNYIGNYTLGDTSFSNVFYEYPDFNRTNGIKGFMAPNFGLIEVRDSINSITYTFNK